MPKEIPILFSTPMVQAILQGRKTITRRVIKSPRQKGVDGFIIKSNMDGSGKWPIAIDSEEKHMFDMDCPYGLSGDILWVRESFIKLLPTDENENVLHGKWQTIFKSQWQESDNDCWATKDGVLVNEENIKWKPSIHMFKESSRIWLLKQDTRVERLQDITEADAIAEGALWTDNGPVDWAKKRGLTFEQANPVAGWKRGWSHSGDTHPDRCMQTARSSFGNLWDIINGEDKDYCWRANPWVWVNEFKVLSTTGKPKEPSLVETFQELDKLMGTYLDDAEKFIGD